MWPPDSELIESFCSFYLLLFKKIEKNEIKTDMRTCFSRFGGLSVFLFASGSGI